MYIYIYIYIWTDDEWWMIDDKGIDYRNLFNQNVIYFYTYYNEIGSDNLKKRPSVVFFNIKINVLEIIKHVQSIKLNNNNLK